MKHNFTVFGMALLMITFISSVAAGQNSNDKDNPKNSRHIKMMKIIDGKKMALDTVITGDQLLVWQGDTINPPKHPSDFSPSGFDKLHHFDKDVNEKGVRKNVMIYKQKGEKDGKPFVWHMETSDDQDLNPAEGDSVGEKIIIRKRMRDDNQNRMIYLEGTDMEDLPPMPPMPPMPSHMKMWKSQQSRRVIDLNDPNIISYKKKDLKGGREKIEIIRNKTAEPENNSFDFQVDDQLMPPPLPPSLNPDALEKVKEFNDDNQKVRIIEKATKVDGKDGKEIKVEVESKDNK